MSKLKTVIMACDRTGGHVYPAQVLADYIRESKDFYKIIFYGVREADQSRLNKLGYDVYPSKINKRQNLLLEVFVRFFDSLKLIIKIKPDCVVGFGGRASFFLIVFGRLLSKTVIYEPNVVYGRSNYILSLFSTKVFLGLKEKTKKNELKVGVPVRFVPESMDGSQANLKAKFGLADNKKTVLVFGGSSGSRAINASVRAMFEKSLFTDDWQIVHITGSSEYSSYKEFYTNYPDHRVVCKGYYDNIEEFYAIADVIVSRSGASSVAELECLYKPVVFVPYPYAYNHQFHNARLLMDTKAIQLIDQKFLDENMLWTTINDVYKYRDSIVKTKYAWTDSQSFAKTLYNEIKKMVG